MLWLFPSWCLVLVLAFAFASTRRENMDKQTLEGELLRYLYVDGNTGGQKSTQRQTGQRLQAGRDEERGTRNEESNIKVEKEKIGKG
jgi:hypothetical protein